MKRAAALVLAFAAHLLRGRPAGEHRALIDSSPAARTAFWGIQIVDLATGKTLYELNPDHFFVPASNTKLFTTALALTRLGPDFTFQTRVLADRRPTRTAASRGTLRLVGGGDPNLSARAIPTAWVRRPAIRWRPSSELADQVAARGVKRIEGDIVGDDTWYVWQPYAVGWAIDDPQSDDGPPVSALTVNDNTLTLCVHPGAATATWPRLTLNPPLEFYRIDNRVRTVAAGGERRIHFDRIPGSMDLRLWGTIPLRDRGQDLLIGIEDPALYAAQALRTALEAARHRRERRRRRGAPVSRRIADLAQAPEPPSARRHRTGAPRFGAALSKTCGSPTRSARTFTPNSRLRAVGRARRNIGSFEAGMEEMKTFLAEAGIDAGGYNLWMAPVWPARTW